MSESDGSKLTARVGLRIHGLSRKCIDQRHSRMWYCKYNPDHHYRQTRTGADCWESMRASESAFLKVQNTTVFGLEKTNFGPGQRLSSKITQAPAHQCAGPVQFWRQKNKSKIVSASKRKSVNIVSKVRLFDHILYNWFRNLIADYANWLAIFACSIQSIDNLMRKALKVIKVKLPFWFLSVSKELILRKDTEIS